MNVIVIIEKKPTLANEKTKMRKNKKRKVK